MSTSAFQRDPQLASPRRKRGLDYALVLIGAALLTWPLLLITGERNDVVETRYQISRVRRENDALVAQQRKLRAELSRLSRPSRIFEGALRIGLRPIPAERRVEVSRAPTEETPVETMVAQLGGQP